MDFALLVLFSAAITLVWTRGSIFEGVRSRGPELWRDLATCPLCSGVWIGGAAAAWLRPALGFPQVFQVLGTGCLTGCAALLLALTTDFLGSNAAWRDKQAGTRMATIYSIYDEFCVSAPRRVEVDPELTCVACHEPGGELEFTTRRHGTRCVYQIHEKCLDPSVRAP